jgi:hypothetical protein
VDKCGRTAAVGGVDADGGAGNVLAKPRSAGSSMSGGMPRSPENARVWRRLSFSASLQLSVSVAGAMKWLHLKGFTLSRDLRYGCHHTDRQTNRQTDRHGDALAAFERHGLRALLRGIFLSLIVQVSRCEPARSRKKKKKKA